MVDLVESLIVIIASLPLLTCLSIPLSSFDNVTLHASMKPADDRGSRSFQFVASLL